MFINTVLWSHLKAGLKWDRELQPFITVLTVIVLLLIIIIIKVNHWSFSWTTGWRCIAAVRRYPECVCGARQSAVLSCAVKYLGIQYALAGRLKLQTTCPAIRESDEKTLPFLRQWNNWDYSFGRACVLPKMWLDSNVFNQNQNKLDLIFKISL